MKKTAVFFLAALLVILSCKVRSGSADTTVPAMTVVSFNSICCGVRSDGFLKTFYDGFISNESMKLRASKVTACGKEGEYKIIFHTKDISARAYKNFSEALTKLIDDEANRNKGNKFGTLNMETMDSIDISYCRGGEVAF